MIAGTAAVLVVIRRRRLPLGLLSGLVPVPLSLAYGIGRLGCLLAGDGTYGRPTSLPWGMVFPRGTMPTAVPVHPTPLYEALAAFAIAGLLVWMGRGINPPAVLGTYLVLSGLARFLVEFVRINTPTLSGFDPAPAVVAATGRHRCDHRGLPGLRGPAVTVRHDR